MRKDKEKRRGGGGEEKREERGMGGGGGGEQPKALPLLWGAVHSRLILGHGKP